MVQSPNLGEGDDLSKLSLVRRSRIGRLLLEREVSAGAVVVLPVPEPGSLSMLGAGAMLLGLLFRLRSRSKESFGTRDGQ